MKHTAQDHKLAHSGTSQTAEFVRSKAQPGASILDVGSGNGAVAKELIKAGFDVIALDGNPKAVEEAKRNGVETVHSNFHNWKSDKQFDLLLFSRSFHHMHPLQETVEHAHRLMKQDALLLMEEFAVEDMDLSTALWYFGLKTLFPIVNGRGPALESGKIPNKPVEHWMSYHTGDHGVAESTEMIEELKKQFELVELNRLAYLYRYFLDDVSCDTGEKIMSWELELCRSLTIKELGLRIVARKL